LSEALQFIQIVSSVWARIQVKWDPVGSTSLVHVYQGCTPSTSQGRSKYAWYGDEASPEYNIKPFCLLVRWHRATCSTHSVSRGSGELRISDHSRSEDTDLRAILRSGSKRSPLYPRIKRS